MKPKHKLMAGLLIVSAALVVYDQTRPQANPVSLPTSPSATPPKANASARGGKLPETKIGTPISREDFVSNNANMFESPEPPAPAPTVAVAPPPPPPPKAPELPFSFIGKQFQGGKWQVFLGRSDRTYVVHANDVLDDEYRVTEIAPPSLVLVYLPMNERQTLDIGPALDE